MPRQSRSPHVVWLAIAVLAFALLASAAPAHLAAAEPVAPAAVTCLDWNIQGQWQYRASGGGYGNLNFLQDAAGKLTGSWHNVAQGSSGAISGQITGASVVWGDAGSGENLQATVDAAGTKMAGTYTSSTSNGTWEATGAAHCLRWSTPLPAGTARAVVKWGEYTYYVTLPAAGGAAGAGAPTLSPQQSDRPPTITFLGDVSLDIDVVIYDTDPPASLQVVERVDGGLRRPIGTLARVGPSGDGGTRYRGRVQLRPLNPIGVGGRETHDVIVVDPRNNEWRVTTVVMLLIDPSGYIYDAATTDRVEGATVSLYRKEGGLWVLWNAAQYLQTNPQVSDSQGRYGWEVPEGDYQVRVSKRCYAATQSTSMHVPPPRTDVNLGVAAVACSPLMVTDIWTADSAGQIKSTFAPGERVVTHVMVSSTATQDTTVVGSWLVTDPSGRRVDAMSGSGTYIVAPFGAELTFAGDLPAAAAEGVYSFGLELTGQGQTLFRGTQFEAHRGTGRVYLPLVLNGAAPQGITGRVTVGGAPAAGVTLTLRHFDGSAWSTVAETLTGSDGRYLFTNAPSLSSGQRYYVLFGPNNTNPDLVYAWYGPDITAYTAGVAQEGGTFDIANVALLSPDNGATVTLPVTLIWQMRGVPGDSYAAGLFDPTGDDEWSTPLLGAVDRVTINALPGGATYGHTYGWYVDVYAAADSFGTSYFYREIRFASGGAGAAPEAAMRGLLQRAEAGKTIRR